MNKISKIIIGIVVIIAIFVGYRAYQKQGQATKNATRETIKIGAVYGLTGPVANLGEQFNNGAQLAVDDINKAGGINEREIEFIVEDSRYDAKTAVSAFTKLIEIDKAKFIATFGSSIALSLKPLVEEKKVLMFADAAHPKITENSNFILRHSNVADSDARVLSDAVKKQAPKKIGIIYTNDDWGQIFNSEFRKNLSELVSEENILSELHNPKDTDFKTQLLKLTNFHPDTILIGSYGAPAGLLIKQLRELGFKGNVFMNNGLVLSPEAQKIAGEENLKGVYYQAYPAIPENFRNAYKEKYGIDAGTFSIYPYTNIELLKYAIEKVGEDPATIASFIKGLGKFKGTYEEVEITPQGDMIVNTEIKRWE